MATDDVEPTRLRGRAPGRRSIFWDTFSDTTLGPFAIPILVMQTAHPDIGAAVARYSIYRSDPWGRLVRTGFSLMRFLYDGDGGKQAEREAKALRELHTNIRGTRPDGGSYHATRPRSFRIVPDTFLDAVVRVRETLGRPLDAAEKEQVFEEYLELCMLFGIKRSLLEPTFEEFFVYYDRLMLEEMTYNETARFLLEGMIKHGPEMGLPKRLNDAWQAFYRRAVYPPIRIFTIGFLDPRFRAKHGIRWSARDQAHYERSVAAVRTFAAVVPRWARTNPFALYVMAGGHGAQLMDFARLERALAKRASRPRHVRAA